MPRKFSTKLLNFFIVLAVILLLIFFNWRGWLGIPKDIIYQGALPFLKSFQWLGDQVSGWLSSFFIIKDLAKENYRLRLENQSLWQENTALKEVARENELLRQRLALGEPIKAKLIFANVIGYNPQVGQYLLIDKGEKDSLSSGLAVVTANNFLIGKVIETDRHSAKVLLISDSNSLINAQTQETRVNGLVRGVHGLGVAMEMIPSGKEIKKGEIVLTSGLDAAIPKGLIIGQISEVIVKEAEIFQKASVQPAADFEGLEQVFVIK